jgi:hypothetical protein
MVPLQHDQYETVVFPSYEPTEETKEGEDADRNRRHEALVVRKKRSDFRQKELLAE